MNTQRLTTEELEAQASAIHEEAARFSSAVLASWESEVEERGGMVPVDPILTRHIAILLNKHLAHIAAVEEEHFIELSDTTEHMKLYYREAEDLRSQLAAAQARVETLEKALTDISHWDDDRQPLSPHVCSERARAALTSPA